MLELEADTDEDFAEIKLKFCPSLAENVLNTLSLQ